LKGGVRFTLGQRDGDGNIEWSKEARAVEGDEINIQLNPLHIFDEEQSRPMNNAYEIVARTGFIGKVLDFFAPRYRPILGKRCR
jgi:hypothetical protein